MACQILDLEIPVDADIILFVEDLMNFMMLRNFDVKFHQFKAGPYREYVYNAFNATLQVAVDFLERTKESQHDDIFECLQNLNSVKIETYMKFGKELALKYFSGDSDFDNFLHYCVDLASIASYFYDFGVTEAPITACKYIYNVLKEHGMTMFGWNMLNSIAQRYVGMQSDAMKLKSEDSLASSEKIPKISSDQNAQGKTFNVTNKNGESSDFTRNKQENFANKINFEM